jgi:hypothetical protein
MAGRSKSASNSNSKNGAALGFEAQLWAAADKMRGHMDAAKIQSYGITVNGCFILGLDGHTPSRVQ